MKLDDEQQAVVDYSNSCVCIAGPGSGKTRTLVAKAEQLWSEGKDLICLTFTRTSAREVRERMPGIPAQTIHSYCYGEVGWSGNYDKLLYAYLDREKKSKFEYVLVDEVQDLTEEELGVVLSIVGDKLFAVGDPYQAIYGWNGSLGMDIMDRLDSYKTFYLRNNYRSCASIVSSLNALYPRELVSTGLVSNNFTAILCRTNKAVKEVSSLLESEGIGYTVRIGVNESTGNKETFHGSETLKVMTCHCSKGLEFDNVILYSWFPEPFWGEEKNLYYTTVARASKKFCEVWSGYSLLKALELLV